ncbi:MULTISPECIES: hypothetical protein [Streptomyces]|uniref:hypothetical protein n=1 Tax=Streptomyces TaxID=1883 RepID=UPI00240D4383|nr:MULTISPECIES: hypothetical protein [Streptomyces]WFB86302.1 hypothetical protein MMU79_24830 [Streptomyces olivaceus]WGK48068.1 hypothetical protein M6G09_22155 [Streptomyces sp. B146]
MTWSAALPGAALRVMRTAAGRRALRVALLMGGLFVLGVLCATRAQAADGAPSLGDAVGRVAAAPTGGDPAGGGRGAEEAPAVRGGGSDAVPPDLRPVTADVVRSATDRIARPVRDTVETAVGEVRATARDVLSTLPSAAPVPPPASPLPSPSLPSLSVPPVSVLPDLSGVGGPSGASDQQGATGRSERPAPDRPDSGPAAGEADLQGGSPDASGVDVPGAAATAAPVRYGPASGAGGELLPDAHTSSTGTGRAGPTAAAEAEAPGTHGDPDGSLGTASGADHGVPRHGDAHAVTPYHRIPLRLVAAVMVRADEGGTRDPYRDIPVSPA